MKALENRKARSVWLPGLFTLVLGWLLTRGIAAKGSNSETWSFRFVMGLFSVCFGFFFYSCLHTCSWLITDSCPWIKMTDIWQHQAFFVSRVIYPGGTGLLCKIHISPPPTPGEPSLSWWWRERLSLKRGETSRTSRKLEASMQSYWFWGGMHGIGDTKIPRAIGLC